MFLFCVKDFVCDIQYIQPYHPSLITKTDSSLVLCTHAGTEHMIVLAVCLSAVICASCSSETFNRREVMQSVWSVSAASLRLAWSVGVSQNKRALTYQSWGGRLTFDRTMLMFVRGKQNEKEVVGESEKYCFCCHIEGTDTTQTIVGTRAIHLSVNKQNVKN